MATVRNGKKRRNKGAWYRANRGWYATRGKVSIKLTDEAGNHIQDPQAKAEADKAYARWLLSAEAGPTPKGKTTGRTVAEVAALFLENVKNKYAANTYRMRKENLFDFCEGFAPRYITKPRSTWKNKIHKGYGSIPVENLIQHDVEQWLDCHPKWGDSTRGAAVRTLKRCFNWAVKMGLLKNNPLRGMTVKANRKRLTYFTDSQEAAIVAHSYEAFAQAFKICIRLGCRFGVEFAAVTADHVIEDSKGMIWQFSATESKNKKLRRILVTPDIAEITRQQMLKYPRGSGQPLFRNKRGKPWTQKALSHAFERARAKAMEAGVKFDADSCMYAVRHTFAKRTLGGYWTGNLCTIEALSALMGNTRQVCWDNYASWCEAYSDPLWAALGS